MSGIKGHQKKGPEPCAPPPQKITQKSCEPEPQCQKEPEPQCQQEPKCPSPQACVPEPVCEQKCPPPQEICSEQSHQKKPTIGVKK